MCISPEQNKLCTYCDKLKLLHFLIDMIVDKHELNNKNIPRKYGNTKYWEVLFNKRGSI